MTKPRDRDAREPDTPERCPTSGMQALGAEAINPAVLGANMSGEAPDVDPDGELVARWREEGDTNAFSILVERHQRRVFGLMLRMLGNREDAEDASQDAFLSLYRNGKRFRGEARFSTFVYRVAANSALNHRRSLGRARARSKELSQQQAGGASLPSAPRGPEDSAAGAEVQRAVQAALMELPVDLRIAVVLSDLEGQSGHEIARALRIPEGTVKSRTHRGRKALRTLLEEFVRSQTEGEQA